MNVSEFAVRVSKIEKGKRQVDITQIREILNIVNGITSISSGIPGAFYRYLKTIKPIHVFKYMDNLKKKANKK